MNAPDYFIPDRDPRAFYPLRSYLRAPSATVAAQYIAALTAAGDLVIDPFACTPTVARVAQSMGRRAVGVESNPLWAWLARTMARLPPASEINAALTRLGDTLKEQVPLRVHLDELYTTICTACRQPTPADSFVHARGAGPVRRHYTCSHCGEQRDDPATEDDLLRFRAFDARGIQYHFAFERVVPEDNRHADRIRRMLDLYTPRNLYALVTLTLKIDSLFHATRERSVLLLLLLHLLDRGTSFYADADPATTAQLTQQKQFVEFNLWRQADSAVQALGDYTSALDLAESPEGVVAAESAYAFVGRGNAKSLAREIPPQSATLIFAAPPSRRLAVWALSCFWGAWILGRASVQSLVPFLDSKKDATWERRWYSDSLAESLNAISELLVTDGRAAFAFTESWQQVIEALLIAAAGTPMELESFLFQPRLGEFPHREFDDLRGGYRIAFARRAPAAIATPPTGAAHLEEKIRASALAAGNEILTRRGEALAFSWIHHAAYAHLAREGLLTQALDARLKPTPGRFVHNNVIAGLSEGYARDFDHYETPTQFVWMRRSSRVDAPLIERVDEAVRELLARGDPVLREDLEDALYRQFPADLTPEAGLIELCAAACADESESGWRWRAQDHRTEQSRALDLLSRLGERLEFVVVREAPPFQLAWKANGEIAHGFIWRDLARFTDLTQIRIAPARGYLVVPEARVALLYEKTRRLPHLAAALKEAGWDFARVPFLERLLQQDQAEPQDFARMTGLVPAASGDKAQLELF